MLFLEKEFKEIKSKLDSFLASGLARSLVPLLPSSLNQTDKHTPAISSQEVSMAPMSPATSLDTMPPDMPESDATTVMPTPVVSNTVTSHSINPTSGMYVYLILCITSQGMYFISHFRFYIYCPNFFRRIISSE